MRWIFVAVMCLALSVAGDTLGFGRPVTVPSVGGATAAGGDDTLRTHRRAADVARRHAHGAPYVPVALGRRLAGSAVDGRLGATRFRPTPAGKVRRAVATVRRDPDDGAGARSAQPRVGHRGRGFDRRWLASCAALVLLGA